VAKPLCRSEHHVLATATAHAACIALALILLRTTQPSRCPGLSANIKEKTHTTFELMTGGPLFSREARNNTGSRVRLGQLADGECDGT
jgi:hypothetical protein